MQVWNVLHVAHCKYRTQKSSKICHLGTIAQLRRAISLQLRHVSTIGKKLLSSNISYTCPPQYGELWPTSSWDRSHSLGHPSKFQRVSRLSSVTAATSLNRSQPNFAWCLAVSWAGTLHVHFWGEGILPGAKFTLHPPSLALSYFGSVTAWHLSSGCKPNFVALSTGRHLYSAGRPSRWALAHIIVFYCFAHH